MAKAWKKRWKLGEELWECENCGRINMSGRPCKCGKTYGAQLVERDKKQKDSDESTHRIRKPASEGKFTKSYFFKDEDK